MTKDAAAYQAVLDEMKELAARYNFTAGFWVNKKNPDSHYHFTAMGLREADLAVVVIYKRLNENIQSYSPDNTPTPLWVRPLGEFLEKFDHVIPAKWDTFTPGYNLDRSRR